MKASPETPLADLEWVPGNRVASLARLGIETLGCLVRHYPHRYEDRRAFAEFPDHELETAVCLHGEVAATALKRFGGRKGVYEATIENASGSAFAQPVICRWFNMPYMQKVFLVGQSVVVYGRPKKKGRQIVIDHPEYEILDDEDEEGSPHMRRIVPIHPAGEGVTPRLIRTLILRALEECELDDVCLLQGRGAAAAPALRSIHFPESIGEAAAARDRLVLDECFAMQIAVQLRRARWATIPGVAKPGAGALVGKLLDGLPFRPTNAQREAIAGIRRDLASERRMHRLLQGDVGSGKTLVALAAILDCIESGHPAVLMAPTQILAEQHYRNFVQMLEPLGVPVSICTSCRKTGEAPLLDSGPGVTVGTHALLYEDAGSLRPGLVVIDEQHKFGVMQRSRLVSLPSVPDILVMTATPIPRTLTQTLYGDLDISFLREKPEGRGLVRTVVRPASKLPEVAEFLRDHLTQGRQAYIVYPLIEQSDKLAAKAASEEFGKWQGLLAPHGVALLHGRTPPDEKEEAMRGFREGRIAALVSTTVIEVGVDVPNATLLLVENAERFGLAQLHQLRGRIGRGRHKSFCILLHDPAALDGCEEKLAALERTSDGFEIAEVDLQLRGPGNLLGTAQSGLPPLRLAELPKDEPMMGEAAALAREILSDDPLFERPGNEALRAFAARAAAASFSAG